MNMEESARAINGWKYHLLHEHEGVGLAQATGLSALAWKLSTRYDPLYSYDKEKGK